MNKDRLNKFINTLKGRKISGFGAVFAIVFMGLATVVLASKLYQLGKRPVAPNVPESRPEAAAGCCAKKFVVGQQTSITPTPPQTSTPIPLADCSGCQDYIVYQSNQDGNWEIYKVQAKAGGPGKTRLTNNPNSDMSPSWLPMTNGQIGFQTDRDGNWEIYLMNKDGTNQRNISNSPNSDEAAPSLSCRYLYFQSNRDGNWEIYRMNLDGTNQTRLTNNSSADLQPAVSKDEKIVFQSNRDGNWELYTMNYDGTGLQRLTNTSWDEMNPGWSQDGSWIAFQSKKSGNWKLAKVNKSGSSYTELLYPAYGRSPVWYPICGGAIFFQTDRDIQMIDQTGKYKPSVVVKSWQYNKIHLFDPPDLPSAAAVIISPTRPPVVKPTSAATAIPTSSISACQNAGGVCCRSTKCVNQKFWFGSSNYYNQGGCNPSGIQPFAQKCCTSCAVN